MRAAVDDRSTLRADSIRQARSLSPGERLLVAEPALEQCAQVRGPAVGVLGPGAVRERWAMAHVAPMTAVEQRHPVPRVVLHEVENALLHTCPPLPVVAAPAFRTSIAPRCYRETMRLTDADYEDLLSLRTGLRRFERWSEQQAEEAGLTPAQHQLLLAVRGHTDRRGPTVGEVADYLLLRHHSAVGLVDRAEEAGLVTRARDAKDRRVVRLRLSAAGAKRLEALSELHREELQRLTLRLPSAWRGLLPHQPLHGLSLPS